MGRYALLPFKLCTSIIKCLPKKKEDRARKWTPAETQLFAKVLADEENCFGHSFERLALKKSSNNEMFEAIKVIFDEIFE